MAVPTTQFRSIPISTATTAIDANTERTAAVAGQSVLSTGVGNEWDFGTVDIASGAANSLVKMMFWNVTAYGGNTTVDTFIFYAATSFGFDLTSDVKYAALRYQAGANGQLYVINATTATYTFSTTTEGSVPASNAYSGAGATSFTSSTDDVVEIAAYVAVAASETTGTYKGTDSGFEFRFNFRYNYS